jgi:hypothetical protein
VLYFLTIHKVNRQPKLLKLLYIHQAKAWWFYGSKYKNYLQKEGSFLCFGSKQKFIKLIQE